MILKKLYVTGICIAFVFLCSKLFAQDICFSGSSKTLFGTYMPQSCNAGDLSDVKETFDATLDVHANESQLFVNGNLSFNAIDAFNGQKNNAIDLASSLSSGLDGSLKELWFSWISNPLNNGVQFGFKVGRQISAWGKSDAIQIADVLCPQDLTSLNASNYSESRLGIDTLKLSLSGEIFTLDVYYVPFFRPSVLPLKQSNPLSKVLVPSEVNGLPITIGSLTAPNLTLKNSSYALRVSFWLPSVDFSFYGYYGYDDRPILNYNVTRSDDTPTGIEINGNYYRYIMAGMDAAIPVGNFVFRFETSAFFDKAFNNNPQYIIMQGDTYEKKNQLKALLGVDINVSNLMITAQYYEDIVFAHSESLDRKARKSGTTISVSKNFIEETLELSLTGAIMWNEFDFTLGACATYNLSDQITLDLEVNAFLPGPEQDGEYGKYKDLSAVTLSGIYRF